MLNLFQHLLGAPAPLKGKFIMDRNLGARDTSRSATYVGVLQYQYGRKDPFPGGSGYTYYLGNTDSKWTRTSLWAPIDISTSVNGPMIYYKTSGLINWCNDVDDASIIWNDYESPLASYNKSIFDPSPKGWKIAPRGTWDDAMLDAGKMTGWVSSGQIGRSYPLADDKSAYYPGYGCIGSASGESYAPTATMYMFTSTPFTTNSAYGVVYTSSGSIGSSLPRNDGSNLRCVQHTEE